MIWGSEWGVSRDLAEPESELASGWLLCEAFQSLGGPKQRRKRQRGRKKRSHLEPESSRGKEIKTELAERQRHTICPNGRRSFCRPAGQPESGTGEPELRAEPDADAKAEPEERAEVEATRGAFGRGDVSGGELVASSVCFC